MATGDRGRLVREVAEVAQLLQQEDKRFKIDAVQAFDVLRRLLQNSNTPVATVARRLVESGRASG
jgi:uncharacterized protein (UPF0147 family)